MDTPSSLNAARISVLLVKVTAAIEDSAQIQHAAAVARFRTDTIALHRKFEIEKDAILCNLEDSIARTVAEGLALQITLVDGCSKRTRPPHAEVTVCYTNTMMDITNPPVCTDAVDVAELA
jgi:hypothetical protein